MYVSVQFFNLRSLFLLLMCNLVSRLFLLIYFIPVIIIFVDVQNLFVYIVPIELILLFSNEKNIIIMNHMYFAYKCKEEFCSNSKEHSFV